VFSAALRFSAFMISVQTISIFKIQPVTIPTGLHPSAQGWPHSGLPWVTIQNIFNPNGVESSRHQIWCNPFRVDSHFCSHPR